MLILMSGCVKVDKQKCRYDPLSWEYPSWAAVNGPAVNILKAGVATADRILTVSQVSLSFTGLQSD